MSDLMSVFFKFCKIQFSSNLFLCDFDGKTSLFKNFLIFFKRILIYFYEFLQDFTKSLFFSEGNGSGSLKF